MGDVGQLGLGEDIFERKKPALVSLPEKLVQVVAGGMHTVCLSDTGNVRDSPLFLLTCVSIICTAKLKNLPALHLLALNFPQWPHPNLSFIHSLTHTITRTITLRFTLSAVTTRAPWVGPRLEKAPSRSQARWRWTSGWSRCRQGTVTRLRSKRTDQCTPGAPTGLVTSLLFTQQSRRASALRSPLLLFISPTD